MERIAESLFFTLLLCLVTPSSGEHGGEDLVFTATGPRFSFLVLGDWGMNTKSQRHVARAMNREAASLHDPLFVLNVGDSFYKAKDATGIKQGGVADVTDPVWRERFEDVYHGTHLQNIPFVSILGNHDYMGNLTAQMLYGQQNGRFLMPDRNYVSRVVDAQTGETLATFVHIDTTPEVGMYFDKPESPTMERNLRQLSDSNTLRWLNATLARVANNAGYKFVVGHHPVVSVHGSETKKSQKTMRERVDKIRLVLENHKVDAYFNGHLHLLEHRTLNGVTYIVSGGGGKVKSYARNEKHANVPGWTADGSDVEGGFATLSVDLAKGEANVRYLDSHGQELFSPNLSHPRRNSKDPPFQPLRLGDNSFQELFGLDRKGSFCLN
eukprot:CAMPEP_0198215400 /NCGR_PEP_ID=MMETSP1445-20131203/49556_1 /TAXON_ID=36898 /ORGANISM="Pyramimonas sp., Strain CCMP2087" /LENGTH=381 /DNA_ID=CAMNT_0043891105 /DNA_START=27 /DNA_END=1173 /DNA_ORIENTATION=-